MNTAPTKKRAHTAAGPAAGYYFQPAVALRFLSEADLDASIAIEADDDIAEQLNGQITKRAQAKHQLVHKPAFSDGSIDLWKTLSIWVKAANNNEFDVSNCKLLLVTNGTVHDSFIRKAIRYKEATRKKLIETQLATTFSQTSEPFVAQVRAFDITLVTKVIGRIEILDAQCDMGESIKRKIISTLNLPESIDRDIVYQGLLGWIHETTLDMWRSKKPAWIKKSHFAKHLYRLTRQCDLYRMIGLPSHLILVPPTIRDTEINRLYVSQLRAIKAEESDVSDAMNDFYRCNSERSRLAREGDLTTDDWISFDDSLTRHWKTKAGISKLSPQATPEETGYALYLQTMLHRGEIAGEKLQDYLSTGSFHRLANGRVIGWHPNFRSLFPGESNADTI